MNTWTFRVLSGSSRQVVMTGVSEETHQLERGEGRDKEQKRESSMSADDQLCTQLA